MKASIKKEKIEKTQHTEPQSQHQIETKKHQRQRETHKKKARIVYFMKG